MTELEKVSHETMKFMRGKYRLDEIGDGKDELKFRQVQKTILTIYVHEDRFTFLIIFGKKEREYFETVKSEYPQWFIDCYENTKTYHDGKWMYIDVTTMEQWEDVKKLILIKKRPNRKPFPKEHAIYSQCGQRCDLCVHYEHQDEALRARMIPPLIRMWGITDWSMRCGGCDSDRCYCKEEPCYAKKCAAKRGLTACKACADFPCIPASTADHRSMLHTEVHDAEEITWGILPYVAYQYEQGKDSE